jgi:hypothetical protein
MASLEDALKNATNSSGYLNAEDKERLFVTQEMFAVVGARPMIETEFGPQTHFRVKLGSDRETTYTMAFGHNDSRAELAKSMQALLDSGEPYVGPIYLRKFHTKKGNDAWVFNSEPLDPKPDKNGRTMASMASGTTSSGSPAVAGDDLPF